MWVHLRSESHGESVVSGMRKLFPPHAPRIPHMATAQRYVSGLVELETFELDEADAHGAVVHEDPAVPFMRTEAEVAFVERTAYLYVRVTEGDDFGEAVLTLLSWLRGQTPTPNILLNLTLAEVEERGQAPE